MNYIKLSKTDGFYIAAAVFDLLPNGVAAGIELQLAKAKASRADAVQMVALVLLQVTLQILTGPPNGHDGRAGVLVCLPVDDAQFQKGDPFELKSHDIDENQGI